MKIIKRIALIFGVILGVLVIIPFFFQGKIREKVSAEIEKNSNAKVYYKDISLSFLRHFPSPSIRLSNFGIIGNAPFLQDTLVSAESLEGSVALMSLFSEAIQLNGIYLNAPKISIKILKDSSANYNIMKPSTDTTKKETNFKVSVDFWKISDGWIKYHDFLGNVFFEAKNINHSGKGDFSQDIVRISTKTDIEKTHFSQKNSVFLHEKRIESEFDLVADFKKKQYEFKEAHVSINDLPVFISGTVAMPDTSVQLDLKFKTEKTDFKKLLSIVPGFFTKDFKNLTAEGNFLIEGWTKGIYNGHSMPSFLVKSTIENGAFKYDNLAQKAKNIQLDGEFRNETNTLKNTIVTFKKINAELGNNKISGNLTYNGQENGRMTTQLEGHVILDELSQFFPIEGQVLKGKFDIKVKADGRYNDHEFPITEGTMQLLNGYLKSVKFPEALENIQFSGGLKNTTGTKEATELTISKLGFILQNQPFTASGVVYNFKNYTWDILVNGKVDLTKITKIYPLKDMELAGLINADIRTKGKMSDIQTKTYQNTQTSGAGSVTGLKFKSTSFPQGFSIESANYTLSPQAILVSNAKGSLGTSTFVGQGTVGNYMGYAFLKQPLKANFQIETPKFIINEWMTESPISAPTDKIQAVEIPKDLDVTIQITKAAEILYEKMKLREAQGVIAIKDGIVKMENCSFNALGGRFSTTGFYNSQTIAHPLFGFALDLVNVSAAESFQNLSVIKTFLPLVQHVTGNVSSKFQLSGELGQDMMPKMATLIGDGIFKILKAQIEGSPLIDKFLQIAPVQGLKNVQLQDLLLHGKVSNGAFQINPFDIKLDNYKLTLGGTNYLDGRLAWNIKVDAPGGQASQFLKQNLTTILGNGAIGDRLVFDVTANGTFMNPKFTPDFMALKQNIANQVKEKAKTEITNKVSDILKEKGINLPSNIPTTTESLKEQVQETVKKEAKKGIESKAKEVFEGFFKRSKPDTAKKN